MAIIGQLTITTEDGITLAALNDLRLAWEWAEHVYGDEWYSTPYAEQCEAVAIALAKIREAFNEG